MGVLIIGPDGETRDPQGTPCEQDEKGYEEIPQPQLEEVVPNSDAIRRAQEEEQIIIAQIINHPLA